MLVARTIFFPGLYTQKTQKAPHHRPQTPSTENPKWKEEFEYALLETHLPGTSERNMIK